MTRTRPLSLPCMPNGDSGAREWMNNFANQITKDTALRQTVGISDEQNEQISTVVKAFDEAYFIASSPGTRTSPNIELKTLARNAAVLAVREVIKTIKDHPQVTRSQILTLRIESRNTAAKQRARYKASSLDRTSGVSETHR